MKNGVGSEFYAGVEVSRPSDVEFQGIHMVAKDYLVVSASVSAYRETEIRYTIVFFQRNKQWRAFEVRESVLSIASSVTPDLEIVLLCRNGDIYVANEGGIRKEFDLRPGFSAVARIGDQYYACGVDGQVATRVGPGLWKQSSVISKENTRDRFGMLVELDGTSGSDIWAVGLLGRVVHFDGASWQEIDSPTNVHLYCVRSIRRGEAYAAGKNGILLHMTPTKIKIISDPSAEKPAYWGLEVIEGRIFVSSVNGIFSYSEVGGSKVQLPPDLPTDTHLLDSALDEMCSVGKETILVFKNQRWIHVPHPLDPV